MSDTGPTPHKILARVPISVRWRDMDSMGHVNNAKYISYLEEARVRWMLGVPGVSMTVAVAAPKPTVSPSASVMSSSGMRRASAAAPITVGA